MKLSMIMSLAAALLCSAAWAADTTPLDVKPGQWESTTSNDVSGQLPIPQEMLDKMTPEQRARMEQAMKARAGQGATAHTYKSCMRKEQLEKPFIPDDKKECKVTVLTSSRSKQELQMDCAIGGGKQSGTFRVEALDSEHVKGGGQMSASNGGRTMNVTTSFSSKWVGPACTEDAK